MDDEVKRIVDEQYQRGMKLLRDNMFLLDELAKLLMEQEKVSGEELVKLINRAAIDGKLTVDNKQMAFAAFTGEQVDGTPTGSKLTSSLDFTSNHDSGRGIIWSQDVTKHQSKQIQSYSNQPCWLYQKSKRQHGYFVSSLSSLHRPGKCLPSMTSMTPTSMHKGFCGSTLRPRHDRAAARNAIARLGLAHDEKAVSSEKVLQEVQRMATEPWTS